MQNTLLNQVLLYNGSAFAGVMSAFIPLMHEVLFGHCWNAIF